MFELNDRVCTHPWNLIDDGKCPCCGEEGLDANKIYRETLDAAVRDAMAASVKFISEKFRKDRFGDLNV